MRSVNTHSTSRIRPSGLPFPLPPPRDEPPPMRTPPRIIRPRPSDISAIAPSMAASRVMSRVSQLAMCAISCATTPCSSSRLSRASKPLGDRDARVLRIAPGREGVGIGIGHHPDAGAWLTRRDRHLLHHVDVLLLLRRGRLDDFPGAGGPQHAIGALLPGEPRDAGGDERGDDADERDEVMVGARPGIAGQEKEGQVAAEADPAEEHDEEGDQPERTAPVALLFLEQVAATGGHCVSWPAGSAKDRRWEPAARRHR